MSQIFRNSSSRAKVLNQSKSSFILLLTLFVAVIVACVMFVNKEALAEESTSSNGLDSTTVSVIPNDQAVNLNIVQAIQCSSQVGSTKYTINSNYADSKYSVK